MADDAHADDATPSRTAADSPAHRTPQQARAGTPSDRRPPGVGGASRVPWWAWVLVVLLAALLLVGAVWWGLRDDDGDDPARPAPVAVPVSPVPPGESEEV